MRSARVLAQAKINVWLHVVGPRPDGYHEIRTLFHRLDLADEVTVRVSDAPLESIEATGPRLPTDGLGPDDRNLAVRAARAYQARTGWPRGFAIELTKHIPVGGGLGGGSADAGAVLRALNSLAPEPLAGSALLSLAATLGSDVPFLAGERVAALGAGRGELLSPSEPDLPAADVLLVAPGFAISTADAYGWLREAHAYHRSVHRTASAGIRPSPGAWGAVDRGNTFEQVVEARHPELRRYRERLSAAGASIARLSGSGSTVFGVFEDGAPEPRDLAIDAPVIPTRTARHVVQVEARE